MRGYPKHLNSKEDFDYVRENFDVEKWLPELKNLLSTANGWFFVDYIEKEEDGITDDTHKVLNEAEGDEEPKWAQYEYRINPTARIFRLGFTVEEVEKLVEGGEQTLALRNNATETK